MTQTEPTYKPRLTLGDSRNALTRLIVINLVVFIAISLTKVFYYYLYRSEAEIELHFNAEIVPLAVLPASWRELAAHPWTVLTAMFTHIGVWMAFANMLWLWSFGYIMQDLTGNRKIAPLYIYGGLAGVLAFLLSSNLGPATAAAPGIYYGAAAGITAIAVATTLVSPGYRLFPQLGGGFPLWWLTIFYLLSSLATVPHYSLPYFTPQLAGGITGYLFVWLIKQGTDMTEWMSRFFDWVNDLFNPDKPRKGQPALKDQLFYKSGHTVPYSKTPNVTQQRIDEILDKIGEKGYNSLTAEEKDILRRAGEDDVRI